MDNREQQVKDLHTQRGLVWKGDFLESLSEEAKKAGYIKFNIPDEDDLSSPNGEGVWGWVTPEDKVLYDNNSYTGNIKAILCNMPINFMGILFWGTEVVLQCRGNDRPTLSREWIEKNITKTEWFMKKEE